jgi:hypothetical protein
MVRLSNVPRLDTTFKKKIAGKQQNDNRGKTNRNFDYPERFWKNKKTAGAEWRVNAGALFSWAGANRGTTGFSSHAVSGCGIEEAVV